MRIALALILLIVGNIGWAARGPLFQHGPETFVIQDANSKTPTFRIFNDTLSKRALALVVNSSLKLSNPKSGPSGLDKNYVDLHLEKIIFRNVTSDSKKVGIILLVSGQEFELDPVITKSDLESGKIIKINIPSEDKGISKFTVTTKGQFALQYKAKENVLMIRNATADFSFENLMLDEESERINFNGKAIRE